MKLEALIIQNNELENHLLPSNRSFLSELMSVFQDADLEDEEFELIRNDLIGMAQEAQIAGESFEDRIGDNVKTFCEETIDASVKKGRKHLLFNALQNLFYFITIQLIINYAWQCYTQSQTTNLVSWTRYLITWNLIIACAILPVWAIAYKKVLIKRVVGSKGKKRTKVFTLIGISFMISFCVSELLLIIDKQIVIVELNVFIVLLIGLATGLLLFRMTKKTN